MNWQGLEAELARWRDAGRTPTFWWRDDDATERTPALERLLALSRTSAVPVALAVVPLGAAPQLFAGLEACVLMHGTDHRNRARAGEKKTEFPAAEPPEQALGRLREARERLAALAGRAFTPVLAPPWNRFPRALVPRLPQIGMHGFTGFGARGEKIPGVTEINTHVDIIDWQGTRGFVGEDAALRALMKPLTAESEEPTGVLTHHAVHDEAAWAFLERLYERTRRHGARWAEAPKLFLTSG